VVDDDGPQRRLQVTLAVPSKDKKKSHVTESPVEVPSKAGKSSMGVAAPPKRVGTASKDSKDGKNMKKRRL